MKEQTGLSPAVRVHHPEAQSQGGTGPRGSALPVSPTGACLGCELCCARWADLGPMGQCILVGAQGPLPLLPPPAAARKALPLLCPVPGHRGSGGHACTEGQAQGEEAEEVPWSLAGQEGAGDLQLVLLAPRHPPGPVLSRAFGRGQAGRSSPPTFCQSISLAPESRAQG